MRTMELEELTAALAGPTKPDREAVLASFRRKHRRKKVKRRLWWLGGLAACAVVALTFVTTGQTRPRTSVTVSPAGCGPAPLAQSLARARQAGASILIAYGSPTGTTAGSGYQGVVLRSVQMLSGPAIASGTTAWADATATGAGAGPTAARMPSGQMLAIAWPAAVVGSQVGPIVRTARVRGGNVLLTRSGCQDVATLAAAPNGNPGPAASTGGAPAPDGLYALPLRSVEQAATSPLAEGPGDTTKPAPTTPATLPSPGDGSATAGNSRNNGNGDNAGNAGNGDNAGTAGNGDNAGTAGNGDNAANSGNTGNGNANGNGKTTGKARVKGNGNG
jgi:hypothetical protein